MSVWGALLPVSGAHLSNLESSTFLSQLPRWEEQPLAISSFLCNFNLITFIFFSYIFLSSLLYFSFFSFIFSSPRALIYAEAVSILHIWGLLHGKLFSGSQQCIWNPNSRNFAQASMCIFHYTVFLSDFYVSVVRLIFKYFLERNG